ncbi:sigma-70 family RNA polymerase sigma factor [Thalassomonas viridans]|uniref:Sigma-70 family RNA polymerase sigma factor n=1 Tax=Thalassomonas viridans TaxID=137584 RepID=A0AAE9Z996_9GAMM|nr:sigma-70 family RNA polymerase sigma factor [Thalassomonas viridans]WDE09051.1 sigma-70 family RNA polymerase sigma factor [Thalassomonas viridans]
MLNNEELNRLYQYGLSLCQNEDRAYDLLQSSLEKYLSKDLSIEHPVAYLRTMMRNRYFDEQRHRKLQLVKQDELKEAEDAFKSLEDVYIEQEQIGQLLQALDDEERELMFLWAVEEYSVQEVANMQGKPKGTLLSKIHRLKQRLTAKFSNFLEIKSETSL